MKSDHEKSRILLVFGSGILTLDGKLCGSEYLQKDIQRGPAQLISADSNYETMIRQP